MHTFRATLKLDGIEEYVSVGCGATSIRAADTYFRSTCPDGMTVLSVELVG